MPTWPNTFASRAARLTTTVVRITCPVKSHVGDTTHVMKLPTAGWDAWMDDTMVQYAFPQLSADDRERLISGICPECFERMFGDESVRLQGRDQ